MTDESRPIDAARLLYRRWGRADRVMHPLGATDPPPAPSAPSPGALIHGDPEQISGQAPEWVLGRSALSPAQERRVGEGLRACAGITAAIAAALVTAAVLWNAVQGLPQALAGQPKTSPAARSTPLPTPTTAPAGAVGAAAATTTRTLSAAPSPTAGQPRTIVIVPQGVAQSSPSPEATAAPANTPVPATATRPAPTVPTAATPAPSATQPPPATATRAAVVREPPAEQRSHTVERGDTLFSIARRSGTTVEALVEANGLGSRDAVLSVGRRLILP